MYARTPFTPWLDGLRFKQGEHWLVAAPTGAGKTKIMRPLLHKRDYVVVCATKPRDDLLRKEYGEFELCHTWPPPRWAHKVLLWPKAGKTMRETQTIQRDVFGEAFENIHETGGWGVDFDELHYMTDSHFLNLGPEIAMMFHTGRSNGLTLFGGTQRPAWIPKIIYSSVSHALIARTRDRQDLQRLSDFGAIDAKELAENVKSLPDRHDFIYLNPQGEHPPTTVNMRH